MNATQLIAALALTTIGSAAFAAEATPYPVQRDVSSTLSRDQVKADLQQALKDGTVHVFGNDFHFTASTLSKSRAQVQADLRASSIVTELTGEAHVAKSMPPAPVYAKVR